MIPGRIAYTLFQKGSDDWFQRHVLPVAGNRITDAAATVGKVAEGVVYQVSVPDEGLDRIEIRAMGRGAERQIGATLVVRPGKPVDQARLADAIFGCAWLTPATTVEF